MIEWSVFFHGAELIFSFSAFFCMILGLFLGVMIAAIPGFPAGLGLVLLVPFTFKMSMMPALLLLSSAYTGGALGGAISAILINIPGSPAAVATTIDGYAMTRNGEVLKDGDLFFVEDDA